MAGAILVQSVAAPSSLAQLVADVAVGALVAFRQLEEEVDTQPSTLSLAVPGLQMPLRLPSDGNLDRDGLLALCEAWWNEHGAGAPLGTDPSLEAQGQAAAASLVAAAASTVERGIAEIACAGLGALRDISRDCDEPPMTLAIGFPGRDDVFEVPADRDWTVEELTQLFSAWWYEEDRS